MPPSDRAAPNLSRLLASPRAALIRPNCDGRHCFLPVFPLEASQTTRGRRCRRSRIQGDRGVSAQRRRTQEGSATRPKAWEQKPTAEAVLRGARHRRTDQFLSRRRATAPDPHRVQKIACSLAIQLHRSHPAPSKAETREHALESELVIVPSKK